MVELQSDSQVNLQKVGFTYPEDVDTDSLEQLKTHDSRLSQTKEILLSQQARLKRILAKFKALKNGLYSILSKRHFKNRSPSISIVKFNVMFIFLV